MQNLVLHLFPALLHPALLFALTILAQRYPIAPSQQSEAYRVEVQWINDHDNGLWLPTIDP